MPVLLLFVEFTELDSHKIYYVKFLVASTFFFLHKRVYQFSKLNKKNFSLNKKINKKNRK